ncbi:G-protein gamma-like domain [Macleaya cordata]|uniref:G-protein gamma-like domain n=1 Tax=Macleaya cordata TaxID=56857 RepID=A0A200QCX1_MACCD|nr:G-protein gamma-like domain [Macleaya cordata]
MAASNYSSAAAAAAAPLSYPCPRSPPKYPDMTGKHRELVKVQKLEREIGFLEEELKSVENLQPASKSCKEVDNYVGANPDPLIPINRKIRRSCRFWKWLWKMTTMNLSMFACLCDFYRLLRRCRIMDPPRVRIGGVPAVAAAVADPAPGPAVVVIAAAWRKHLAASVAASFQLSHALIAALASDVHHVLALNAQSHAVVPTVQISVATHVVYFARHFHFQAVGFGFLIIKGWNSAHACMHLFYARISSCGNLSNQSAGRSRNESGSWSVGAAD